MQSHACTASGSLLFRCDSVLHRSMPRAGPLPVLISLGRYMPTKRRRYISHAYMFFTAYPSLIPNVSEKYRIIILKNKIKFDLWILFQYVLGAYQQVLVQDTYRIPIRHPFRSILTSEVFVVAEIFLLSLIFF